MAKQSIKQIGDLERASELGKNQRSDKNPYSNIDAQKDIDGSPVDKAERIAELGRNEFTEQKPYDSNSIDW